MPSRSSAFTFSATSAATASPMPHPSRPCTPTCSVGAGVSLAYGAGKALGAEGLGKVCAVLGDSTFLQWGIAPVIDTVYNKGYATTIIADNRTTGMTGLQEHPGSGRTIKGEPANMIDYEQLVRALGVRHVRKVDSDIKETMEIIGEEARRDDASVRHHPKRAVHAPAREEALRTSLLRGFSGSVPRLQSLSGAGLSRHQLDRRGGGHE